MQVNLIVFGDIASNHATLDKHGYAQHTVPESKLQQDSKFLHVSNLFTFASGNQALL